MKKLIPLLFLLVLTGCATTSSYQLEITGYERPLPKYPLKAIVYYLPKVENSQLLEMEYNQFGNKQWGTFKVAYGTIIFTKFESALGNIFKEKQRSMVADRPTRLLEAKSKNSDLLCEIELAKHEFKWEKQEGFVEGMVKGMFNPLPRKTEHAATSNFEIKAVFYRPDGSVVLERAYPYSETQSVYFNIGNWNVVLFEASNEQFKRGVDEIIDRIAGDLRDSKEFTELVNKEVIKNAY